MSTLVIPSASEIVEELLRNDGVQQAFRTFESDHEAITAEQIDICSIPAPPFGERKRADYLCKRFRDLGLADAHIDEEGNCIAYRAGESDSPLLVVSAHLDTVFPEGTDCSVRRSGSKLLAPGISDDSCGLVALLSFARALQNSNIQTRGSLLFVGTVGEEGEGDLRGVRYLLTRSPWSKRINAFISFDGPGVERITNRALASRRYRVSLSGSGGHSWGDFGTANPVHALGRAIAKLTSYPLPPGPKTTFNVGHIEGGASVNAIPANASMDVDLRSSEEDELLRLDAFFRRAIRAATEEENAAQGRRIRPLELTLKLIGERPGGETPLDNAMVQLALQATQKLGCSPRVDQASTDSNLPMSLRIPALTLGAGGTSGKSHTLEEWYDPGNRELGLKRGLLVLLGMVGVVKK